MSSVGLFVRGVCGSLRKGQGSFTAARPSFNAQHILMFWRRGPRACLVGVEDLRSVSHWQGVLGVECQRGRNG